MEIQKIFSDYDDIERYYSVLIDEDELMLFSEFQKEFGKFGNYRELTKAADNSYKEGIREAASQFLDNHRNPGKSISYNQGVWDSRPKGVYVEPNAIKSEKLGYRIGYRGSRDKIKADWYDDYQSLNRKGVKAVKENNMELLRREKQNIRDTVRLKTKGVAGKEINRRVLNRKKGLDLLNGVGHAGSTSYGERGRINPNLQKRVNAYKMAKLIKK